MPKARSWALRDSIGNDATRVDADEQDVQAAAARRCPAADRLDGVDVRDHRGAPAGRRAPGCGGRGGRGGRRSPHASRSRASSRAPSDNADRSEAWGGGRPAPGRRAAAGRGRSPGRSPPRGPGCSPRAWRRGSRAARTRVRKSGVRSAPRARRERSGGGDRRRSAHGGDSAAGPARCPGSAWCAGRSGLRPIAAGDAAPAAVGWVLKGSAPRCASSPTRTIRRDDLPSAARLSPRSSAMKRRPPSPPFRALAVQIALTSWLRVSEASARIVALPRSSSRSGARRPTSTARRPSGHARGRRGRATSGLWRPSRRSLRDRIAEFAAFTGEEDAAVRAERGELLERCQEVLSEVHAGAHASIGDPEVGERGEAREHRALGPRDHLVDAEGPRASSTRYARPRHPAVRRGPRELPAAHQRDRARPRAVRTRRAAPGRAGEGLDTAAKREWLAGLERLERSLAPGAVRGELELAPAGSSPASSRLRLRDGPPSVADRGRRVGGACTHAAAFIEAFSYCRPSGPLPHARARSSTPSPRSATSSWRGQPDRRAVRSLFAPALLSRHTGRTRLCSPPRPRAAPRRRAAPPLDLFGGEVEVEQVDGRVRVSTTDFLGRVIEIEL